MVNTMVKDPGLRKINRKLDRQKKARMRLNQKALVDSSGSPSDPLAKMHTLKITELKKARDKLKEKSGDAESKKGD